MKILKIAVLSALLALAALAQTTTTPATTTPNILGIGLSWNQGASATVGQQFAGTAMYAREQTTAGTYAYGVVYAVPQKYNPVSVTTSMGVGIAQKIVSLGAWDVFGTISGGPSWSGGNTGWNWNFGGLAAHPLKGKWWIGGNAGVIKSSVNNNSDYQFVLGIIAGIQQ